MVCILDIFLIFARKMTVSTGVLKYCPDICNYRREQCLNVNVLYTQVYIECDSQTG